MLCAVEGNSNSRSLGELEVRCLFTVYPCWPGEGERDRSLGELEVRSLFTVYLCWPGEGEREPHLILALGGASVSETVSSPGHFMPMITPFQNLTWQRVLLCCYLFSLPNIIISFTIAQSSQYLMKGKSRKDVSIRKVFSIRGPTIGN